MSIAEWLHKRELRARDPIVVYHQSLIKPPYTVKGFSLWDGSGSPIAECVSEAVAIDLATALSRAARVADH